MGLANSILGRLGVINSEHKIVVRVVPTPPWFHFDHAFPASFQGQIDGLNYNSLMNYLVSDGGRPPLYRTSLGMNVIALSETRKVKSPHLGKGWLRS